MVQIHEEGGLNLQNVQRSCWLQILTLDSRNNGYKILRANREIEIGSCYTVTNNVTPFDKISETDVTDEFLWKFLVS